MKTDPRCKHCGGELAPEVSIMGARRCLSCGNGTIPEPCGAEEHSRGVPAANPCGRTLECGGTCVLDVDHFDLCLCAGDDDGPGTCPA